MRLVGCVGGAADGGSPFQLWVSGAFNAEITRFVLSWPLAPLRASDADGIADAGAMEGSGPSVFPTQPLPAGSPLSAAYSAGKADGRKEPKGKASGVKAPTKKGALVDLPVTFRSRIKSSGYGSAPAVTKMFTRPGQAPRKLARAGPKEKVAAREISAGVLREYPLGCGALDQRQRELAMHAAPVMRVSYSSDAHRVATAAADNSVGVARMPAKEGSKMMGHNAHVHSVGWAHSSELLVSASDDGSARLWEVGRADALMVIDRQASSAPAHRDSNPPLSSSLKEVSFFYLDKFILLAAANRLMLFKYKLDDTAGDDIKRLKKQHKFKLVSSSEMRAKEVTCFSCHNSFHSNMVVAAGSSRSVEVWDHATAQRVLEIPDAHERPIGRLVLNYGSTAVSLAESAYNQFVTTAPDGMLKLWDIRTGRCSACFTAHVHRTNVVIGASFSPCQRYIGVGSEDRAAYIMDVRRGGVAYRIAGHNDVVSDVCFSPIHPQLVTACFDGKLRFFSSH
jgi:WD40 repeat protein